MKYFLFGFLLLSVSVSGQNLIPNGSFEDTVACPNTPSQYLYVVNWLNPTTGTPNYFNYCSNFAAPGLYGYQVPQDGDAYTGIILGSPTSNEREYMEVPLVMPLTAGNCYRLSFYANSAHHKYTTDAIHAYVSDSLIIGMQTNEVLPFVPQISNTLGNFLDTLNWTLIQGEFVATGFESHVIIGNFKDKLQCNWFLQDSTPGVSISSYTYIDNVSLIEIICTGIEDELISEIVVYPNPANNTLQIRTNLQEEIDMIIYDALMKKCIDQKFTTELTIDISGLSQGSYYYTLHSANRILKNGVFFK